MKLLARLPKDVGYAIRQTRKAKKLTQKELAVKSGIWQETISKIENGTASANLETIFDLLAALDIEMQIQPRSKGSEVDMEAIF